jgi:hypothetical protein
VSLINTLCTGHNKKSWFKYHAPCTGHNKSCFWTARHLLKYSICGCILIVPSSLSSYIRSFMTPTKLTNREFLLSLQPRKHKLPQVVLFMCQNFQCVFGILFIPRTHLFNLTCVNNQITHNSITIDTQVFIYPDTFWKTLKVFKTWSFFKAVFVFLKDAPPEDYAVIRWNMSG